MAKNRERETSKDIPAYEKAFRRAMAELGLYTDDEIIPDTEDWQRFNVRGDQKNDKSGFYKINTDGIATGIFGCWRLGRKQTWCMKDARHLSAQEKKGYDKKIESLNAAYKVQEKKKHKAAKKQARSIWEDSSNEKKEIRKHLYLKRKQVENYGLRLYRLELVIPLYDEADKLCSLQFINKSGKKRFLKEGKTKGCFFVIGTVEDEFCICEGYATAASIYEATKLPVVVAFNAGNLPTIAEIFRKKYPDAHIIICADNDYKTDKNPGLTKAREAALAIDALLSYPR